MNEITIKPAENFDSGIHILEKVGSDYNLGTIYSEDGDNLHCFILGAGRKTIAKTDSYQIFITEEGVDYLYNEQTQHLTHVLDYLEAIEPTIDITGEETDAEKRQKFTDYTDALYPYLSKKMVAADRKVKIVGDKIELDRGQDMNFSEIGRMVENIGRQHLSLETKGQTLVQSLELRGMEIRHITK